MGILAIDMLGTNSLCSHFRFHNIKFGCKLPYKTIPLSAIKTWVISQFFYSKLWVLIKSIDFAMSESLVWGFLVTDRRKSKIFRVITNVIIKLKSVTNLNSESALAEVSMLKRGSNFFPFISRREQQIYISSSLNILIPSFRCTHLVRHIWTSFLCCAFGAYNFTFFDKLFFFSGHWKSMLFAYLLHEVPYSLLLAWSYNTKIQSLACTMCVKSLWVFLTNLCLQPFIFTCKNTSTIISLSTAV